MTSLFSEKETKNNCDAQQAERNSSCFPDILICIALRLFFLHGWCHLLPVEELVLLWGQATFL